MACPAKRSPARPTPRDDEHRLARTARQPMRSTPNFKLPSQWKATLSGDWRPTSRRRLGLRRRLLLQQDPQAVICSPTCAMQVSARCRTAAPRYGPYRVRDTRQPRRPADQHEQGPQLYRRCARFDKNFDFGLSIGGSYTFQDVKDHAPAPRPRPSRTTATARSRSEHVRPTAFRTTRRLVVQV